MPFKITIEKEGVMKVAADAVSEILKREKNKNILLFLSGGSSLSLLSLLDETVFDPNVTLTMLDERWSLDENINSFLSIKKTPFYKMTLKTGVKWIETIPLPSETLEDTGKRLDLEIKRWKKDNENGFIAATVGVGEDGHIAGMLPFPENAKTFEKLFEDKKVWFRGYNAAGKNPFPERVTSTAYLFSNLIDEAVGFAMGEKKANSILRIIKNDEQIHECPVLLMRKIKSCTLYTDQAVM